MSAYGVFVTGTDTGVGKTVVACALMRGFAALGRRVAGFKPVASGSERSPAGLRNADALALAAAGTVALPYDLTNPYCFEPAISPHIAAEEAGIVVDLGRIRRDLEAIGRNVDWIVAEGAGGWLAPVGTGVTMADLARTLGLPVLLVVGLRLGCLNHAHLTGEAIRAAGVPFAGWIGSHVDAHFERVAANLATLERSLGEAPLALVPQLGTHEAPALTAAARLLSERELKHLKRLE